MKIGSGDPSTTWYVVDKNRDYAQVLEERDANGTLAVRYVYGLDLIAQVRGTNPSYYHYDGLGSTRQLTDASASAPTDTYTYEAFGRVVEQTYTGSQATPNDYLYTGEQYDGQTSSYYLRARYYQPGTGRFTGRDGADGYTSDPITLHKYLYGGSDPVNQLDPGGDEFAMVGTLSAVSIQNTLASVQAVGGRAALTATRSALLDMNVNQTMLAFAVDEAESFAIGVAIGAAVALTAVVLAKASAQLFEKLGKAARIGSGRLRIAVNAVGSRTPYPKEMRIGEFLADELGYDVLMRGKNVPGGDAVVRTADGILLKAEFKTLESSTLNAFDQNLRKGVSQLDGRPGAIVIDARETGMSIKTAREYLDKTMPRRLANEPLVREVVVITNEGHFVGR